MQVVGHVGLYVGLIVYTALGAKVLYVDGSCHVIFINITFIYYLNPFTFSLAKKFTFSQVAYVSVMMGTIYVHVQCTITRMLSMRVVLRNPDYAGEKGKILRYLESIMLICYINRIYKKIKC